MAYYVSGFAVELDPDGIVDEGGYGGGIVFGYSQLKVGEDQMDFDVKVFAEQGVDGCIDFADR